MIIGIFRSFEPSNYSIISLLSITLISIILIIQKNSKTEKLIIKIKNKIETESIAITKNKIIILVTTAIFISIIIINISSINPISFTITSQPSVILPVSIPLFLRALSIKINKNFNNLIISLVPINCPTIISPILVIIELIRIIIRPVTLSIRLIANLISGHLIIHLLSKIAIRSILVIVPTSILSTLLVTAEILIAILQSYIFFTLIVIYYSD